ncbi:hypothetical protein [Massilia sp. CCM 8734]|uniref:hypothetical protein n=1 Tax=Massilia sp. CCM 8734 TaxID=2609283 RepID=UPI0014231D19|nr:hypothetical protein [Massilia sp. CCM 8734]NHZ95227.1 hypothetical protein [Massilia sp. CCM 8734]
MNANSPTIDDCAQQGRAVLTVTFAALLVVAALVLASALGALGAWGERLQRAAPTTPLAIILFCAWVRHQQSRAGDAAARKSLWRAMFQDEFRRQSLARALRIAFGCVLLLQLPLALLLESQARQPQLILMACLSMLTGALAFLGAFLYLGRAEA